MSRPNDRIEEYSLEYFMKATQVPAPVLDARLDNCPDIPVELVSDMRKWARGPQGIVVFCGIAGCGKSYLAAATLAEIALNFQIPPNRAFWCAETRLLQHVKFDFGNIIEDYTALAIKKREFLVFDDFGFSMVTDVHTEAAKRLIFHRYDNKLPMIISTNLDYDNIYKRYGGQIASRLEESGHFYKFPKRDLRKTGALKFRTKPGLETANADQAAPKSADQEIVA